MTRGIPSQFRDVVPEPELMVTRRYLDFAEADGALRRGKSVKCFLGRCERDGRRGIRWLSLNRDADTVRVDVFETADLGSEEMLDLYDFGPLDSSLPLDAACEQLSFGDLAEAVEALDARFPGASRKLVNEGFVQDEFADFISRGSRDA